MTTVIDVDAIGSPTDVVHVATEDPEVVVILDTEGSPEADVEEIVEEVILVGRTTFSIVGIRYYSGVVHPGEFCTLIREPRNPYDSNAIRIENLSGEKVGHIKREQAAILAQLMDRQKNLRLESTIPWKGNNWSIPVAIDFYSVSQNQEDSESIADRLAELLRTSFRHESLELFRDRGGNIATTTVVQKKTLNWEQEQEELDTIFEKQTRQQLENLPKIPMPTQFTDDVKLLEHQVSGIRWLAHQETDKDPPFFKATQEKGQSVWLCEITQHSQLEKPKPIRGSILADEMGMGKTIMTLGLILCAPPEGHVYSGRCDNGEPSQTTEQTKTTMDEDSLFAEVDTITKSDLRKMKIGDIRDVLARAGRQAHGKKAELIDLIGQGMRDGSITALHFLKKTSFPTTAQTKATRAAFCTLIVTPVSVISNWIQQIENHVKEGVLRVAVYAGSDRYDLISHVEDRIIDVLLVSYHTLASDYAKASRTQPGDKPRKKQKLASLFDLQFHRVVLDEAHMIRSCSSRLYKAVKFIRTNRKLALTGTPFVNRPDDIYSLFSFLDLRPLNEKDIFRRCITSKMQIGDDIGLSRLRAALAHVALRRSKNGSGIKLAEKSLQLRLVSFPEGTDKEIYDALFSAVQIAFRAVLTAGDDEALKNYSSILEVLLRLRQACCSGNLIPKERREAAMAMWREVKGLQEGKKLTADEGRVLLMKLCGAFDNSTSNELPECSVCLTEMEESCCMILRTCLHIFCETCLSTISNMNHVCPLCRSPFRTSDMIKKTQAAAVACPADGNKTLQNDYMNPGVAPKISALHEAIKEMQPDEKGVVFSQFTKFLDLIGLTLQDHGIEFCRIDGSMNTGQRTKSLAEFASPGGPRLILCSLHAAGTGINLTAANVCFLMDSGGIQQPKVKLWTEFIVLVKLRTSV